MLEAGQPKWRRRKEARPGEILEAAFDVFSEKGFAAARLDDIATRAGVSKGALYLYFETKEALFQAMIRERVAPNLFALIEAAKGFDGRFSDLIGLLLPRAAQALQASGAGKVVKIVIGESRNFPELARFWRTEVVGPALSALTELVARGQARGEIRSGEPRLIAMSVLGPMMLGVIWREVMEPVGGEPLDLEALAGSHVNVLLGGVLEPAHA